MSALTWKYVIWILALDVLLIYSLQPKNPLYALFLSVLLWKIVIHDASMDKIEAKLLLLLFIMGALLHERDVFFYLWQCSFSAAVFCGSYKLCTREQIGQQESYLHYDIIGVMLVLLYDLLVLPRLRERKTKAAAATLPNDLPSVRWCSCLGILWRGRRTYCCYFLLAETYSDKYRT